MSITERLQKIKSYMISKDGLDIGLVLIVILASLGSFGLGRLSVSSNDISPVIIDRRGENSVQIGVSSNTQENSLNSTNKVEYKGSGTSIASSGVEASAINNALIVASKRGNKYYFTWCSGAKSLSEANKIYFNSEDEAIKAGYTKSTSCK